MNFEVIVFLIEQNMQMFGSKFCFKKELEISKIIDS